jgi:hypothetical protein
LDRSASELGCRSWRPHRVSNVSIKMNCQVNHPVTRCSWGWDIKERDCSQVNECSKDPS